MKFSDLPEPLIFSDLFLSAFLIFIYLKLLSQIVIFFALLLTSQWTVPPFLDFLPPRHRFCHIRQFLFSDTMSIWLKHRRVFLIYSFSFFFPDPGVIRFLLAVPGFVFLLPSTLTSCFQNLCYEDALLWTFLSSVVCTSFSGTSEILIGSLFPDSMDRRFWSPLEFAQFLLLPL